MDTYPKSTPKVRKNFMVTPAEDKALAELVRAGYPFPAESEVGALRKMIRQAWKDTFPGIPFPQEEAK